MTDPIRWRRWLQHESVAVEGLRNLLDRRSLARVAEDVDVGGCSHSRLARLVGEQLHHQATDQRPLGREHLSSKSPEIAP